VAPLACVLGLALLQEPPDGAARRDERLERALAWLSDPDAEVREMGRKTLMELGRSCIPALEAVLKGKGALEHARLLALLDRGRDAGAGWVEEGELPDLKGDEEFQKELKKVDKPAVERYVQLKYAEALACARAKNYQRGYDLAHSLLQLEPRCAQADAIRRLRRHCEAMITQTTLIEAKLVQSKLFFVEGEPLEVSARLKNVYRSPVTLIYDQGTPEEPGGGMLLLESEIQIQELRGAGLNERKPWEIRFEKEVPIAPGAQWERRFTVDSATSIPDEEHIKVVTVNAWTQPLKIQAEGVPFTRRLQFEPARLRIVPRKHARFLEKPLEWLERMMEGGTTQEVFICSQLLEGKDRDTGAELLVRWMARAESEVGRIAAAHILTALTGRTLGTDPRRWLAWLQDRDLKDKKKP
jgi:hypothetical protein